MRAAGVEAVAAPVRVSGVAGITGGPAEVFGPAPAGCAFSWTIGAVGLVEGLAWALEALGPADVFLVSWTSRADAIARVLELDRAGLFRSFRWIVDPSMFRRRPAVAAEVRARYGPDVLKTAEVHVKLALVRNERGAIMVSGSGDYAAQRLEWVRVDADRGLVDGVWRALEGVVLRGDGRADGDALASVIGPVRMGRSVCVLSPGAFDLIDVLGHVLEAMGPARVHLACWTVAREALAKLEAWRDAGKLIGLRWLLSREFASCRAGRLELEDVFRLFGEDAIRPAEVHAKVAAVVGPSASIAILTSANPNRNARLEVYWVCGDAAIAGEIVTRIEEWFADPELAPGSGAWWRPGAWHRAKVAAWHGAGAAAGGAGFQAATAEDAAFFGDGPFDRDLRRRGLTFRG